MVRSLAAGWMNAVGAVVPLCGCLLLGGCFPIELDIDARGRILIARAEGWFLFDPATDQVLRIRAAENERPVWGRFAPNSHSVLTVGELNDERGLYAVTIRSTDGGDERSLTRLRQPTYLLYSPDGGRIAATQIPLRTVPPFENRTLPELVVIDPLDRSSRRLASNVGPIFRWLPNSTAILAVQLTDRDPNEHYLARLVLIDVETGGSEPLANLLLSQEYDLDLALDGKRAAICCLAVGPTDEELSVTEYPPQQLHYFNLSTREIRPSERTAQFARFSPDGRSLLFGGNPVTGPELWTMPADGGASVQIARDLYRGDGLGAGGSAFPGWIDNERIYYLSEHAVYGVEGRSIGLTLIHRDGTGRRRVQPTVNLAVDAIQRDAAVRPGSSH